MDENSTELIPADAPNLHKPRSTDNDEMLVGDFTPSATGDNSFVDQRSARRANDWRYDVDAERLIAMQGNDAAAFERTFGPAGQIRIGLYADAKSHAAAHGGDVSVPKATR